MIDSETELLFGGEVCIGVRAQVGRLRRICCHRFNTGLSMTPKRRAIGAFEFEALEQCYQAFSKFVVNDDMIDNVRPVHILGLFAA